MAENKTQPTDADVAAHLDAVEPETRRDDARALAALMARVTGEPPRMWGPSIIGFGVRRYRYDSGREGETMRVGFAARKAALVLYGLLDAPGAEAALARLGKHKPGKGCVYLKRLSDADPATLEGMIADACAERSASSAGPR